MWRRGRFEGHSWDVVDSHKLDLESRALNFRFRFDKNVSAGSASFVLLGPKEGGDGQKIGDEALRCGLHFSLFCIGCSCPASLSKLLNRSSVRDWVGDSETFRRISTLSHRLRFGSLLFGLGAETSVKAHDPSEAAWRAIVDSARWCQKGVARVWRGKLRAVEWFESCVELIGAGWCVLASRVTVEKLLNLVSQICSLVEFDADLQRRPVAMST